MSFTISQKASTQDSLYKADVEHLMWKLSVPNCLPDFH